MRTEEEREADLKGCAMRLEQIKAGLVFGRISVSKEIYAALGYEVTTLKRTGASQRWTLDGTGGPLRYHSTGAHWSTVNDLASNLDYAVRYMIPPGWFIAEMKDGQTNAEGTFCEVRLWCPQNPGLGFKYRAMASTPALAVCAAALRCLVDNEGWDSRR